MSADCAAISWTTILKFEKCIYKDDRILVQPLLEGHILLVQRRKLLKRKI